jgi:hypothetical protein
MANLGQMGTQRQPGLPMPPKGDPIARYTTYLDAQRAVDFLSDNHFPVQYVTIVGSGLRMVERVTGRLTYARVAVAGAASGAWFGLFVGLLLSLFSTGNTSAFLAAPLIGAAFGVLFGVISYAFTGGRRDFTSTSQIVASEYEVLCMPEHKDDAVQLLRQMPQGTGPLSTRSPLRLPEELHRHRPPSPPPADLPPPTGTPSPGPGPGQPGGPPMPPEWRPSGERPGPSAPPLTYGEAIERKKAEERERASRGDGDGGED